MGRRSRSHQSAGERIETRTVPALRFGETNASDESRLTIAVVGTFGTSEALLARADV